MDAQPLPHVVPRAVCCPRHLLGRASRLAASQVAGVRWGVEGWGHQWEILHERNARKGPTGHLHKFLFLLFYL